MKELLIFLSIFIMLTNCKPNKNQIKQVTELIQTEETTKKILKFKSSNTRFKFEINESNWKVLEIGSHYYYLENILHACTITMITDKNKYQNTSSITKSVESEVELNPDKFNFIFLKELEINSKKFKTYSYEWINTIDPTIPEIETLCFYYEYIEEAQSLGFIVEQRKNEKIDCRIEELFEDLKILSM